MSVLQPAFQATLLFWFLLLVPAVVFALCIHGLERFIQRRLVSRFGWRSVLVTGWLGTPIHEMSHVAMCLLFRHRVDEVQLFDPDVRDGRLGFVRHSFRRGNWFEEIGNLFVGTAPLLGGSLVLGLLTLLFFPQAISVLIDAVRQTPTGSAMTLGDLPGVLGSAFGSLGRAFDPASFRFWMYAYLVTCVAAHMAPSRSDYAGAWRGTILGASVAGLVTLVVFLVLRLDTAAVIDQASTLLAPALVIAAMALGLVTASAGIVAAVTAIFPRTHGM